MSGDLVYKASVMRGKFPEGTMVKLFGVSDVPDGTEGKVDFVDDIGQVFIETPENFKNVCLSSRDVGGRVIKVK